MPRKERPLIVITMGDPAGIGPEVVAKALAQPEVYDLCRPLVIGNAYSMSKATRIARVHLAVQRVEGSRSVRGDYGLVEVLDPEDLDPEKVVLGRLSAECGRAAVGWVLLAGRLALQGDVAAMVTAPINKEAASLAAHKAVGHMELLRDLAEAPEVATMLMAGPLRVVHLTTHRSLRQACDAVTKANVLAKLLLIHRTFQQWGFPRPRIGVAALNPHASDGGLLGNEEAEQISPAVQEARRQGIEAFGPVPADILFYQVLNGRYDVALAMYHDQGHIPIKVYGFERSVSVTLGLPFIRTSVDHGTAFDIAGQGVADHRSMLEALRVAAHLALHGRPP